VLGYAGGFAVLFLAALATHRRRLAAAAAGGTLALAVAVFGVQLVTVPVERLLSESESGFYNATYDAPERIQVEPDRATTVAVTVTNTGTAAWTAGRYSLGHHWLDPNDLSLDSFGNEDAELGAAAPGEAVQVNVELRPPWPADRLLAWDVHQRSGEWFAERGIPVLATLVDLAGHEALPPAPRTFLVYPALLAEPDRGELWSAAIQMIREQPLLGVGPGTYRLRYGPYIGLERWDTDIHSNNSYLELGATTGLIGLGSFLLVILYALWREARFLVARRATSGPPAARWMLVAGFAAAGAAFLVHGTVDYFLGVEATLGLFWVIVGTGVGLALGRRTPG
jgi:hypothetical protein